MAKTMNKDIIGADVRIGTNEAQNSLTKLTKSTSELSEANSRMQMQQAKLIAAGQKNSKAYKALTDEINSNKAAIKDNREQMNALQKTMGVTQMSAAQLQKRASELKREMNGMVASADPAHYKKLSKELDSVNLQFGKVKAGGSGVGGMLSGLQSKLGGMPGAFGSMANGIIGVGKAAAAFFLTPVGAIIGIIAAVGMGAKALIKNSLEFGKAASSLSAITGATGKDLDYLKQQARDISKESTQSATDMLGAFEKIGSAMPALLKNGPLLAEVTKNAVVLSEATGGQLAITDAANAAAAAMNQFNIPLDQSARAVNVLAAGSLEGSADIMSISESLKNVGAVANGANLTLENTTAALEVLAIKQLKGSEAGTALRGVILKLQAAGVGYTSGVFNFRDALEEANKKIGEQGTALERDAYMQKLFGQEGITAGKILLSNVEAYDKLNAAVTGTNTAYDQQRVQNDNLAASNKKLKEAWKNLMLGMEDGTGVLTRSWKFFIDGLTADINLISGIIDKFRSKEAREKRAEIKAAKDAETAKRAELMATAKQLGLTVDEKISLFELERQVTEEQARQQAETAKLLLEKQAEEEEKARKDREAKAKAARDKAFNDLENANRKELNELKKLQIEKGLTQDQFNAILQHKEIENLTAKLELQKKFGEDTSDTESAILDKQIKLADDYAKRRIEIDKTIQKAAEQVKKDMLEMDEEFFKEVETNSDNDAQKALKRYEDLENLKKELATDEVKRQMDFNAELANLQLLSDNGMLLSHEQYEQMKAAITAKYAKQRFEKENEYLQAAQNVLGIFSSVNDARKAMELKRAGDDAKKKEEIEKKYAKKQQKIAMGQALINGALAQLKILADVPKVDFGVMTAILMAAAAAATAAEVATIASQQFEKGRYPIRGASDGRTYSSAWAGKPKTGIYNKPMLGLFSEKEPEAVIDGRTLKSLVWNYPSVWRGITTLAAGGVPQFADGRYPASPSTTTTASAQTVVTESDPELKAVMKLMADAALILANKEFKINAHQVVKTNNDYENAIKAANY